MMSLYQHCHNRQKNIKLWLMYSNHTRVILNKSQTRNCSHRWYAENEIDWLMIDYGKISPNLHCNVIIVQEQFWIVNQCRRVRVRQIFTNEHMFHKYQPNFFCSREVLACSFISHDNLTNFQLCTTAALVACMYERGNEI